MPRTCIASRQVAEPDDLIRLVPGPDGGVLIDYRCKVDGRGAWVLPRRQELELLEKKPQIVSRALRCEVNTANLLTQVRAANLHALEFALSIAARAGLLSGGREGVRAALSTPDAEAILIARDASERLKADLRGRAGGRLCVELPFDTSELGARIGKGSRAALVLRRGKASVLLLRELRRLSQLS